jgi:hypothetical protein
VKNEEKERANKRRRTWRIRETKRGRDLIESAGER